MERPSKDWAQPTGQSYRIGQGMHSFLWRLAFGGRDDAFVYASNNGKICWKINIKYGVKAEWTHTIQKSYLLIIPHGLPWRWLASNAIAAILSPYGMRNPVFDAPINEIGNQQIGKCHHTKNEQEFQ
jgi:hypothetical protein